MGLKLLHARLVAYVRRKLRSGELTERALARLTGVSQPHLHNVIKGVRVFSLETADQIMERLHIDILTLLTFEEPSPREPAADLWESTEIPILEGSIGPGRPFPDVERWRGRMPFLRSDLSGLERPVAARLGADPQLRHLYHADDVALMELLPRPLASGAEFLSPEAYYAIDAGESSLIRRVERRGDSLLLWTDEGATQPVSMALAERNILEVVRARVVWVGHYLRKPILTRG